MTGFRAEDVEKRYGDVVALDGVSLQLPEPCLWGLVGPNGSGKTTLIRCALGLTRPDAGSVSIEGSVGASFQEASAFESLTVEENLDVFGRLSGADDDWIDEVVDRLRLGSMLGRTTAALSAGYRKKLDLGLALAKRPDVLLLDEPLADLDDPTKEKLVPFLAEYAAEAVVVVSTHDLEKFARYVDGLTVVGGGRVLASASREHLPADLQSFYVQRVLETDTSASEETTLGPDDTH